MAEHDMGPETLTLSRGMLIRKEWVNQPIWKIVFITDVKRACELLEKLQKSKYCGEVPATKLAALQKVLQSEFLNAVREVYEHVYETVDVQGNPEIRASATAKVLIRSYKKGVMTLRFANQIIMENCWIILIFYWIFV